MSILHGRNSANGGDFRLLGVGSPLLDILVRVDEEFLATVPGEKGGMLMVDVMLNMWAFDGAGSLSTAVMDGVISMFGLDQ